VTTNDTANNETPSPVSWAAAILLMVIGVMIGMGYTHYRYRELQREIDRTAPIAVIRLADFLRQLPAKPSQADMKGVYEKYAGVVDRLAAAGYLVIDAQGVAGAPEDLYVPTPD